MNHNDFLDMQSEAFDVLNSMYEQEDLNECIDNLKEAFPNGFINHNGEFIAHLRSNTYFILNTCKTPLDIECKVLEWFSRAASKGIPYSQEWRNRRFRKSMLKGINKFLETDFTEEEMIEIYTYLGNACHHAKTIEFIQSDYDFSILHKHLLDC